MTIRWGLGRRGPHSMPMPNFDSSSLIPARLRVVAAGPAVIRPGVPCAFTVEGWEAEARPGERGSPAISWQVLDADGRPVADDGYQAPHGLSGDRVTVVFPTQLHRAAHSLAYLIEATVEVPAPVGLTSGGVAGPAFRLRPATVYVSAIGPQGVRALLAHLGHSLVAGTPATGLSVPVPPPPLELLGMPPLPVTATLGGPDRSGGRPVLRLSVRVPTLGTIVSGPIPLVERRSGADHFRTSSSPATSTRTASPSA